MPVTDTSPMTCPGKACHLPLPQLALCASQAMTTGKERQRHARVCFHFSVDICSSVHTRQETVMCRALDVSPTKITDIGSLERFVHKNRSLNRVGFFFLIYFKEVSGRISKTNAGSSSCLLIHRSALSWAELGLSPRHSHCSCRESQVFSHTQLKDVCLCSLSCVVSLEKRTTSM